ncbi:Hypothetical_protein [Hexamita inflata]|uniref:Hypothetical_protein n=1 Tax=Hexamita inflata TaxID=28002 RepID=A0ABP1GIX1_9EUKA
MVNIHDSFINCSDNTQSTSVWAVSGSVIGQSQKIYDSGLNQNILKIQIQQCIIYNNQLFSTHKEDFSISGGLIGDSHTSPLIISQIIVNKSIVQAKGEVLHVVSSSGLIAYMYCSKAEISEVQIINNKFIATSLTSYAQSSSSIFSHVLSIKSVSSINIKISNSLVSNITLSIYGPSAYSGIIQCNNRLLELSFNSVSTSGKNIIDDVIITNCQNVISQQQNGC